MPHADALPMVGSRPFRRRRATLGPERPLGDFEETRSRLRNRRIRTLMAIRVEAGTRLPSASASLGKRPSLKSLLARLLSAWPCLPLFALDNGESCSVPSRPLDGSIIPKSLTFSVSILPERSAGSIPTRRFAKRCTLDETFDLHETDRRGRSCKLLLCTNSTPRFRVRWSGDVRRLGPRLDSVKGARHA